MTTVYQQAAQFVERGIAVFPVRYRDKRPGVPSWEVYKTTLPDDRQLRAWFPSNLRNYAVCLGWQNLAVLDFDDMTTWYSWQNWALENCRILDAAYCVKTARGVHLYMTLLETLSNKKLPGIDFKTCGYVVGPGSTHPSGHVYHAMSDALIFPIVEKLSDVLPAEIYELAVESETGELTVHAKPPGEGLATPGDLWDEIDQGTMFDVLSPVEKIKRRWKLENFFPGEKQDRQGYLHVCCPFHKDEKPSAWVDTKNQIFGCHSCNMKPMSVIGFYAALHQTDIKQAIKEMLK